MNEAVVRICVLCGVILGAACLDVSAGGLTRDNLEIPQGTFNSLNVISHYEGQVKDILLKDFPGTRYARMIALPSFEPEWAVTIRTAEDSTVVEYASVDQQIWGHDDPDKIQAARTSAVIPADMAQAIEDVWEAALFETRYPVSVHPVVDGTTYYFSAAKNGQYDMVGISRNPPPETLTSALAEIGSLLKDYVVSEGERETLLKKIQSKIDEIKN